jgi:FixJ family two-component response regulator
MNGWELARALRERDASIPLAVITGWGETVSASQKEEARVDWLLSKPFSMAQIVEIGEEVVALRKSSGARRAGQTQAVAPGIEEVGGAYVC